MRAKDFIVEIAPFYMDRAKLHRLHLMAIDDQGGRQRWADYLQQHGNKYSPELFNQFALENNLNPADPFGDTERQKKFKRTKYNFCKFNTTAWEDYWLLAQHCDDDRAFQQKALDIIKKYKGTVHSHYRYLSDRLSMAATGKQQYGTQYES